jgi:3-hydroxyacyl-CoA dehydrogenase/enoyl-CoA hydratase/3-hydroxybutyryl-CoA epimerase/3-hydroxyacyl-CoA dehydrogenase/enoyl-CoA hydratase/3-hydroxybutyryl-CoA epimerase/enoyl-CoA isomerase
MNNNLASDQGVPACSLPSRPVDRVGVLGAGQMGAGIAAAMVRAGLWAAMVDLNTSLLDIGRKRVSEVIGGKDGRTGVPDEKTNEILSKLETSTSLAILSGCDAVIEAVTEDEAIKIGMFRELEAVVNPAAILASNTSTIPISRLARAITDPGRFAGMHFFHPVHRMGLIEVIRGEQTSDQTTAALVALAIRLEKTPIVVRDCPGFLVTRVMFPYLSQALSLLEEGVSIDAIDAAAVGFGMPMGPIAVIDLVGLDTVLAISRVMAQGYPDRARCSPLLAELVRMGRLGRKSGAGFRNHSNKGSRPVSDPTLEPLLSEYRLEAETPAQEVIVDRLFISMLLEAIRVLEDDIVRNPADIDAGVILGLGFPKTRGGILGWCDTEGAGAIMNRLVRYSRHGPWFQPPASLRRMALEHTFFRDRAGHENCP